MDPTFGIEEYSINAELAKYSKKLWQFFPIGAGTALLFNITFIMWSDKRLFAIAIREYIIYLISLYAIQKYEDSIPKENLTIEQLEIKRRAIADRAKNLALNRKEVTCDFNGFDLIKVCFGFYLVSILFGIFNDKLIYWLFSNLIIFNEIIERYHKNFMFEVFMAFKANYEGIVGVIECFIPKYVPPKKNEEKDEKNIINENGKKEEKKVENKIVEETKATSENVTSQDESKALKEEDGMKENN